VGLKRPPLSTLAALAALHPHVRGGGVDYAALFLASMASWALIPGPGEAALIAAGISAAHHHLSLASVLLVAWAGAGAGASIGWLLGMKGGRGPLALLLTPPWIAGIHHMRWSRFLPASAGWTLVWALTIGLGAYFVGPSITDIAADAGLAGGLLVALLFVVAVVVVLWRRSHRSPKK